MAAGRGEDGELHQRQQGQPGREGDADRPPLDPGPEEEQDAGHQHGEQERVEAREEQAGRRGEREPDLGHVPEREGEEHPRAILFRAEAPQGEDQGRDLQPREGEPGDQRRAPGGRQAPEEELGRGPGDGQGQAEAEPLILAGEAVPQQGETHEEQDHRLDRHRQDRRRVSEQEHGETRMKDGEALGAGTEGGIDPAARPGVAGGEPGKDEDRLGDQGRRGREGAVQHHRRHRGAQDHQGGQGAMDRAELLRGLPAGEQESEAGQEGKEAEVVPGGEARDAAPEGRRAVVRGEGRRHAQDVDGAVPIAQAPAQEEGRGAEGGEEEAAQRPVEQRQGLGDHHEGETQGEQGHGAERPALGGLAHGGGERLVVLLARAGEHQPQHGERQGQEGGVEVQQGQGAGIEHAEEQERHEMDRTVGAIQPVAMEEEAVDVAAAEVEDGAQDHGGEPVEELRCPGPAGPDPRQHRLGGQQGTEGGGIELPGIAEC
jgi:hypothetical protein